jgi:hypothetical protein
MSDQDARIRIDLTPEQQRQLKEAAGYDVSALEFSIVWRRSGFRVVRSYLGRPLRLWSAGSSLRRVMPRRLSIIPA